AALPLRVTYHRAELRQLVVVRAQGVVVHEQGRDAEQVDHYRLGQELDAGEFGEALADQKVPVAMDEIRRRGCAECAQRLQRRLIRRDGVVPYPGFVEVAEDIERLGPPLLLLQKAQEQLGDPRPAGVEMQVGDEQDLTAHGNAQVA